MRGRFIFNAIMTVVVATMGFLLVSDRALAA